VFNGWESWSPKRVSRLTRRDLGRLAGFVALGGFLPSRTVRASEAGLSAPATAVNGAANLYRSLGVRPFINCRGTITVIGGSMELAEVRAAKNLANQQYVQLDELMEAAGKRLAELTGAEWGMVSAGCSAAISHATAACVAGGNPDLHVRLPDLSGFPRDEVIVPRESRNSYDPALKAVGVKIIEVETADQLRLAIGPKTAMIYVVSGSRNETGPMSVEAVAGIAKSLNVPVLVDAAPEILTIPNVHLQRGATLVAYSGGKVIRGPQSAGLLLGRKDLVKAAWIHSAPHHGYARSMKVGREEVMGMLAAVESWVKRDHDAEWNEWVARCDHIANRVTKIPGVTASVRREPGGRGNRSPRVSIMWDSQKLGITGAEVTEILDTTEPRIVLGGGGGGARSAEGEEAAGDTGISITAFMMAPGDEKIVADRVHQVLSAKRSPKAAVQMAPPAGDLSGRWNVNIQYTAGKSTHTLHLYQQDGHIAGAHAGDFTTRELVGTVEGDRVSLISRHSDGVTLTYRFSGQLSGDSMSGSLDMGEYLTATWTATRTPRSS
jgi:D-glucosaminate-6-phosphate ammonia-lyase